MKLLSSQPGSEIREDRLPKGSPVASLVSSGYVDRIHKSRASVSEPPYPYISLKQVGRDALAEFDSRIAADRIARRRDWIRWSITTLIALTGLVNSILARLGL